LVLDSRSSFLGHELGRKNAALSLAIEFTVKARGYRLLGNMLSFPSPRREFAQSPALTTARTGVENLPSCRFAFKQVAFE
jgi:hypothetical protein